MELEDDGDDPGRRDGIIDQQISWLGQHSLLWYLVEKNWIILRRQLASEDDPSEKLVVDTEALSEPFRKDLSAVVKAAKQYAEQVVLVTFSTHLRRDQTSAEQKEAAVTSLYYMPYMSIEGLITAFEAYNRAITDVAQAEGAVLISGENDIPGDSAHFVDSVHFTDRGASAMAERVFKGLIAADMFNSSPLGMAEHHR